MNSGRILILGDSTLSSLGGCGDPSVDIICRQGFSRPLEIINPSAVGYTAADAWITLQQQHQLAPLEAAVVYVGNCDACALGYLKPYTKSWKNGEQARKQDEKLKKRNPLAHRNPPFTYQDKGRTLKAPPRCVSPADHGKFLDDMAKYCHKQGIRLIVINPVSKLDFPPLNNMGNFVFYRLAGIKDRPKLKGGTESLDLIRALEAAQSGDVNRAKDIYRQLCKPRGEPALIAANNLAGLAVEEGQFQEAREILLKACNDKHPMQPMFDFSLAQLSLREGDTSQALRYMALAHAKDTGSYRVTEQYRGETAKAAQKHGLSLIDSQKLWPDDLFLDYCHPGGEGHQRLAQELTQTLARAMNLSPGEHRPSFVYQPLNPDCYMGLENDFFTHFGLVKADPAKLDQQTLLLAHTQPYEQALAALSGPEPDAAVRIRKRILAHPLFGMPEALQASPPEAPCDQGRLPEFYFMRHLVPALRGLEDKVAELLGSSAEICPRWQRMKTWWPSPSSGFPEPELDALGQALRPDKVAERMRALLRASIEAGPVCLDKYRSISYWFFRESLVFGTVSHFSMYIDRMELLMAQEAALITYHVCGCDAF